MGLLTTNRKQHHQDNLEWSWYEDMEQHHCKRLNDSDSDLSPHMPRFDPIQPTSFRTVGGF